MGIVRKKNVSMESRSYEEINFTIQNLGYQ